MQEECTGEVSGNSTQQPPKRRRITRQTYASALCAWPAHVTEHPSASTGLWGARWSGQQEIQAASLRLAVPAPLLFRQCYAGVSASPAGGLGVACLGTALVQCCIEVMQTTEKPWVLVQKAETLTRTANILLQQGSKQQLLPKEVRCAALLSVCNGGQMGHCAAQLASGDEQAGNLTGMPCSYPACRKGKNTALALCQVHLNAYCALTEHVP